MLEWLRAVVLTVLHVPPEPKVPEGSPGSVLVFRAGRNFYRRQVLLWAVSHLGAASGLIVAYVYTWRLIARAPHWVQIGYQVMEVLGAIGIVVALPVTFLALKWEYELRWYIVTDRSLRIRSGVWNVEELTMTFANIQEIRVTSGPIQNLLGLADVEVSSAGGGATGSHGERSARVAAFEGVDNADEIRDLIVDRLRVYRDLGLGGPTDAADVSIASRIAPVSTLTAAQSVLDEARALRRALSGTRS